MARGKRKGVLIAGGGLAGSLAALALARLRPDVPLLIVEEKETFGGDRFRTLFGGPIGESGRDLVLPFLEHRWPGYYVSFPGESRKLKSAFGGFGAESLHRAMVAALKPDQYRLGTKVVAVREDALVLDGGETIKAEGAIDARGAANLSMLDLLFEARVERLVRLKAPHRLDRPVLIDATIDQSAGFSFMRAFPLGEDRLLVAKALVSERSLPNDAADARIDHYLRLRGWQTAEVEAQMPVVRPLPVDGDFDAFWRIGGARAAKLGLRGGFLHPATGSTITDAVRNALLLAEQTDFAGAALHDLFEQEAKKLWKSRQPLRDFNSALKAAAPADRRALVHRLYRFDPVTIGHFHGDRLDLIERMRFRRAFRG